MPNLAPVLNVAAFIIFMGLSLFCVSKVLQHKGASNELAATKWAVLGLVNLFGMICCLASLS